jgi:hypothetical protein
MLIILAHNTTGTKEDGTSDYNVEARVNERVIAKMTITGHVRDAGAAALLRKIADVWENGAGYRDK